MYLYEQFSDEYVVLNQQNADDDLGSYVGTYTESDITFMGALSFKETHITSEIENLGINSTYNLLIPKDMQLEFHQVIKNKSNGRVYRVTTDSRDVFTPASSALNLRLVGVEDWSLEDNYNEEEDEDD